VYFSSGNYYANGSTAGTSLGSLSANGTTVGVALDLNNRKVWFRKAPSGDWNNNSTHNPATGVGGITIPTGTMVPFVTFGGAGGAAGNVMTANFGASAFVGAVPSGFAAGWTAAAADVIGPSSAVANRIAVFGDTSGKTLADGGKLIADMVLKAGDTMTGNLTIAAANPVLTLAGSAGANFNNIVGTKGGVARWMIVPGHTDVESGGNTGSDFKIYPCDDGGSPTNNPVLISRATGNFSIAANTASSSPTTGALTVAGGLGVNNRIFANADIVTTAGYRFGDGAAANGQFTVTGGNTYLDYSGTLNIRPTATYSNAMTFGTGITVGAPTGGDKGLGTLNAVSVYDDNVLLTCFGAQYAARGTVDLAQWDAVSPTGKHDLAHKFVDMLKDFDPRNPQQYIEKLLRDEALPGMPTFGEWKHGEQSLGAMQNRLWLAVELLATAFAGAVQRIGDLEAKLGGK
jgi:hypothetical protein